MNTIDAQDFVPGETYFDSTGFVEYRAGNLPIIFSAPHGGNWRPDTIPDRDCAGCSYSIDSYTRVITWGIYEEFFEQTGCYPHMIMNRLHRIKFDANRDIGDAADGNPLIESAWRNYHSFIDIAKEQSVNHYGRGLFLDIHGHVHTIQRIELGYLLSKSELQLSDAELNTEALINESSIQKLSSDNIQFLSHAELLRGEDSFGTLMDHKGFPCVPSFNDPFPDDGEDYFTGGYNTQRHGSRDSEDMIDAIQIELNQDIRFDDDTRETLIDSITQVAIDYYTLHYDEGFQNELCNLISGVSTEIQKQLEFTLYPNPVIDNFTISGGHIDEFQIMIYSLNGQQILSNKASSRKPFNIEQLPTGLYFIHVHNDFGLLGVTKLFKN